MLTSITTEPNLISFTISSVTTQGVLLPDARIALSNIFAPILLTIGEEGGIDKMLKANKGVRHGVYLYKGILTNQMLGESLKLPYKDINLLIAAF